MNKIKDILYPIFLRSTGVSKDTRSIAKGNIYFALKGANFNGNAYAQLALDQGAICVVLDERQSGLEESSNVVYVDDSLIALQDLGQYHRSQIDTLIIGLTGSNGKTTTKELLYSILSAHEPSTYATAGNYNNHIGVPLTLLSIPKHAKYAIVEMGTNQPGDIKELCDIANPDIGLITNIGKTHLERLKTQQGVYQEKSSLYQSIKNNKGTFFQNISDPFLAQIKDDHNIQYSKSKTANSELSLIDGNLHLTFHIKIDQSKTKIKSNLFGAYNIENIAAAITIAEYLDVPINTIKTAIEAYTPANMRSQVIKTEKNIVIMDAYNANPISVQNAIKAFTKIEGGSRLAIIGDMLELGVSSNDEHQRIIDLVIECQLQNVIFIGEEFGKCTTERYSFYNDVSECMSNLKLDSYSDNTILLKGSRGVALEKLLPLL